MRNTTYINILAAVGRTNLIPASEIPTAAEAARKYYDFQKGRGHKSLKDVQSLIGGRPLKRRSGRRPKVGSFGDHILATPMHRILTEEVTQWFVLRVPPECSASYRKKVKSFLSGFLHYCHSQGWISPAVLIAADEIEAGDMAEDRRWLTPEQLAIYDTVVAEAENIDDYHAFVWELFRDNGIRTFEGPSLTPASLETGFDGMHLNVVGKGPGAGKRRSIRQTDENVDSYLRHVARYKLRPDAPMLFQRRWLLLKGEKDVMGWVEDRTRPASSKAISGVFERIQDEVNRRAADGEISPRDVPHWKLTAKVMRKTFACNQLILARIGRGGMDLVELQEALGHSSLTTTKVYLADVEKYLGKTIKRVSTAEAARMIIQEKARRESAS